MMRTDGASYGDRERFNWRAKETSDSPSTPRAGGDSCENDSAVFPITCHLGSRGSVPNQQEETAVEVVHFVSSSVCAREISHVR